MNVRLNIARWIAATEVEGPGKRFALWVQGCNIGCADCCNPEMLPFEPRLILRPEDIVAEVVKSKEANGIEGITLLGGEPCFQAKGLSIVARHCQSLGVSVMMFTGIPLERLERLNLAGVTDLLAHTDVVVDGPFVRTAPDRDRNWIGSKNQRVHYLTDRYSPTIETDKRYAPSVEVRVSRNGHLTLNGTPFAVQE